MPGSSIGALAIGMAESRVADLYGKGRETQWRSAGRTGTKVTFSAPGGALFAASFQGQVVQIGTTSSYYRTEDGIHVNSVAPYGPFVTAVRREAALRTGELERLGPNVYSWRGFIYEDRSYCLRGNNTATQLVLTVNSSRVSSIVITHADFLTDLEIPAPASVGTVRCGPKPLQRGTAPP